LFLLVRWLVATSLVVIVVGLVLLLLCGLVGGWVVKKGGEKGGRSSGMSEDPKSHEWTAHAPGTDWRNQRKTHGWSTMHWEKNANFKRTF